MDLVKNVKWIFVLVLSGLLGGGVGNSWAASLDCKQTHYLQSGVTQWLKIQPEYISCSTLDASNLVLQVQASPDSAYTFQGDSVQFWNTGDVTVYLKVSDGADTLDAQVGIEVLDFERQSFLNSDFDYAPLTHKIDKWVYPEYGDAFLRDQSGNVVLELNTGEKDTLLFETLQTKLTKVTIGPKYQLKFKIKKTSQSQGSSKGFKAWLTYGANWAYKDYSIAADSLSSSFVEYTIPFEVGFKGSIGLSFHIYGTNQQVQIDGLKVLADGVALDISSQNFEDQNVMDLSESHNWILNEIADLHLEKVGLEDWAAQFTANDSSYLHSQNIKTFLLDLGETYHLRFQGKANVKNAKLRVAMIDGNGVLSGAEKIFSLSTSLKEYEITFNSPISGGFGFGEFL